MNRKWGQLTRSTVLIWIGTLWVLSASGTSRVTDPDSLFTLTRFAAMHPDSLYPAWKESAQHTERGQAFNNLLTLYRWRQATDDNYTLRVVDGRTDSVLLVRRLMPTQLTQLPTDPSQRSEWEQVDRLRRTETRALVDDFEVRGIPRRDIIVKWGRASEVQQAQQRDRPFDPYELEWASHFGLSLLATEISTVETFNDDRLVSSVGARSRYQFMPDLIERFGLSSFVVPTRRGSGLRIRPYEHPLHIMEPAMITMRAYSNAVGHEIPGLSAYHSGPYNIFAIYRAYLSDDAIAAQQTISPLDAYIWGITAGFETVSQRTSFRNMSRGYVPALYGSLYMKPAPNFEHEAFRGIEITWQGESTYISDVLNRISDATATADHGAFIRTFKRLNTHIPWRNAQTTTIDPTEDLVLGRDTRPLTFFLPMHADSGTPNLPDGVTVIKRVEPENVRPTVVPLPVDLAYQDLIQEVSTFDVSLDTRTRLVAMVGEARELYAQFPTAYRYQQLMIMSLHEQIWRSDHFERLVASLAEYDERSTPDR